ncbi:MAG: hypothetical protein V1753_05185 [Pseudomonadota bacterium]
MPLIPAELKLEAEKSCAGLSQKVKVLCFTQSACSLCRQAGDFAQELAALSKKLMVSIYDADEKALLVTSCGLDKFPAYVILAESGRDYGFRAFGVPVGYAFQPFMYGICLAGRYAETAIDPTFEKITAINRSIHIEVIAASTSQACINVIRTAYNIAYINDKIRADWIDVSGFPDIAKQYNVQDEPRVILNGSLVDAKLGISDAILTYGAYGEGY